HTRFSRDWSSDVCSSDLPVAVGASHTLTFTATDAAGRDMGRRRMAVTCGSLDAEASVDGVRVTGEAAGTARVVCIWQGIADMVRSEERRRGNERRRRRLA